MVGLIQGVFYTGPPPKSTKKLILARLGVSWTIYVNVDSPNLGFPYLNFLGEAQCKKTPCICRCMPNILYLVVADFMRYNTLTSISHGGDCMSKGVVYVAEVTDLNTGEKETNTGLTDGTTRDRICKPQSNREHVGGKILVVKLF